MGPPGFILGALRPHEAIGNAIDISILGRMVVRNAIGDILCILDGVTAGVMLCFEGHDVINCSFLVHQDLDIMPLSAHHKASVLTLCNGGQLCDTKCFLFRRAFLPSFFEMSFIDHHTIG
eukprot:15367187-Ditylum_brightwellii.AAC.1